MSWNKPSMFVQLVVSTPGRIYSIIKWPSSHFWEDNEDPNQPPFIPFIIIFRIKRTIVYEANPMFIPSWWPKSMPINPMFIFFVSSWMLNPTLAFHHSPIIYATIQPKNIHWFPPLQPGPSYTAPVADSGANPPPSMGQPEKKPVIHWKITDFTMTWWIWFLPKIKTSLFFSWFLRTKNLTRGSNRLKYIMK